MPADAGAAKPGRQAIAASRSRHAADCKPNTPAGGCRPAPASWARDSLEPALAAFLEHYGRIPYRPATAAEYCIHQDSAISPTTEAAIRHAMYGNYWSSMDSRGQCFRENNFKLRNNRGGGDCLFHSLAGTAAKPSLSEREVLLLRDATASVRETMPEDETTRNWNGHQVALALNQSVGHGSGDARRAVDNALFARLQRIPGIYAGDTEIAQWLNIPGNPVQSVTVIDAQPGNEGIFVLTRDSRKFQYLAELGETEDSVRAQIAEALSASLEAERRPGVAEHVALYRSTVHYQRIVGLQPRSESRPAPSSPGGMNRDVLASDINDRFARFAK